LRGALGAKQIEMVDRLKIESVSMQNFDKKESDSDSDVGNSLDSNSTFLDELTNPDIT